MKILYIYRHPDMGFSIGKVFRPIEEEMKKYAEVNSLELPCSNYSLRSMWKNIKAARKAVKSKKYDVIHITGAEHYLLPFLSGQCTVITVHDLGFFTNHKFGLHSIKKYFLWIQTLPWADYVTFISSKSEKEALRFVQLKETKHSVVCNPVGSDFRPCSKKINTEKPVILHVGIKPNKNLESTAIALKGFPCKLRIIGELTEEQVLALKLYKIDYECVSKLSDEEIVQEYINCDYVNFPSLYEGFGMPIIEGQAIGRPILTSNLSPMKEVAGDGAILVNPTSPEEIRKGYERMKQQTDNLVALGYVNVRRFSLGEITAQYLSVYKKSLQGCSIN